MPAAQRIAAVVAHGAERPALEEMARLLDGLQGDAVLTVGGSQPIPVPASVRTALEQVVRQLAQGSEVIVLSTDRLLTTTEAAAMLNISRPYLSRLLQRGEIPSVRVGTHWRVRYEDVAAYKHRRDVARRQVLDELTGLSDEYGLYDPAIARAIAAR